MIKQDFRRNFAARHPLFAWDGSETGIRWKHSAYYLWWEFLRRHDGYLETCLSGGQGAYSQLYADFGDVHGTDFKTWWTKDARGLRLFAEPRAPVGVVALSDDDSEPTSPDNLCPRQSLIKAIGTDPSIAVGPSMPGCLSRTDSAQEITAAGNALTIWTARNPL
jgi:hypothetical protein